MTIMWVDNAGAIIRATAGIPDPLPLYLSSLTPIDVDVVGAPYSGKQMWDFQSQTWGEILKSDDAFDKANISSDTLRALSLVILDQINALRADHARPALTPLQLRNAVAAKLQTF